MTERGAGALRRSERTLGIGPSAVSWDDGALTVEIDEVAVPLPRRVRGRVRIMPAALTDGPVTLDAAGRHSWWPIAPSARIEASFERPALTWSGHGYVDSNWGSEPLEDGFASWHWSRTWTPEATTVLYDGIRRDGTVLALARRFDGAGQPEDCPPPSALTLPRTGWRIARRTRALATSRKASAVSGGALTLSMLTVEMATPSS